jgi:hypothetical protein
VDTGLFSVDGFGTKYEVQYYPTIDSIEANGVSPASGSLAGGTEVVIRGHGFSMDEEDIHIEMGGSKCEVVSSTLEEIICITDPVVPSPLYTSTTGSGLTDCATVAEPPTVQGECASCNPGADLSGGLCREIPTAAIILDDAGAQVEGMVSLSSGGGQTFVSDEGAGKGSSWAIFSGAVALSGTYEVKLGVPASAFCTPRATSVPVVVHHSGTARRTVVTADLTAPGPVVLGSFYFDAPMTARVIVDNKGTTDCVGIDFVQLDPVSAARPSEGCMDTSATNFEPAATSDDGSCLYVGGRGLLRHQWALMPPAVQDELATSSPASVLQDSVVVDRACPLPGEEDGWEFISGTGEPGDCKTGRCPSHDACPADSFCCLDSSHARCTPPLGTVSAFDSEDGWMLVMRQVLPSTDRINGGYFLPGDHSKNPEDPTAPMYSILDRIGEYQTDDHMYELKLKYPGKSDIHWKQSANPASGESLLNSKFEYVEDNSPVWHLMFKQEGCEITYDAGPGIFNSLFDRSTWPIVRFDRVDESTGEMAPYAYYRRVTTVPREMSLYDTLLGSFSAMGEYNIQDVDWRAFSSEVEAIDDTNPWVPCIFTGRDGRGFPGDCGAAGDTKMRWISKDGCDNSASPNAALYIYAPQSSAAVKPTRFRGLSSALAPAHGHILDGEGLDVITPHDDIGYVPWFGVGVTQTAPAENWQSGIANAMGDSLGWTFHWWHHQGDIPALRNKPEYPDSPDGVLELTDLAEIPHNVRDHYAGRMFGWYRADQDGPHNFYIASDDNGELWFGEEEAVTEMIAHVPSWVGHRQWNNCGDDCVGTVTLKTGKFYYMEALFQEGGGGDNLAVGVIKPDGVEDRPISVKAANEGGAPTPQLFTEKVDIASPREMELAPCASEGELCEFPNMALVRYSLGWPTVPSVYAVETDGVTCRAFGSGIGGEEYVNVASDLLCDGEDKAMVEELAPDWVPDTCAPSDPLDADTDCSAGTDAGSCAAVAGCSWADHSTEEDIIAACQAKCDARADCNYFVVWENQACMSYATCVMTDEQDPTAADGSSQLYINTRRTPGSCDYVPVSSNWNACSDEGEICEVTQMSVVRFGAGSSFNYRLVEVNETLVSLDGSTVGVGQIQCSTRTFGLGSPGVRRCQQAYLGIPARIAGHEGSFEDQVELWVKPRTQSTPVCQLCSGCIDADGKIIRRNLAHESQYALWTDGSAGGPVIQGDVNRTVDGSTAIQGIVGGKTHAVTCSSASGDAGLKWSVDLGSAQALTSVKLWSTVSAHAAEGVDQTGSEHTGYRNIAVWASTDPDYTAEAADANGAMAPVRVLCGLISHLRPASDAEVACTMTAQYVWVTSADGPLGLCEVEVFGTEPACPSFCVADQPDYPAPIAATHQLVTLSNGLVQDPSCDPATAVCDGEDETLNGELPAKSTVRLGGAKYEGFFVAPVTGDYTFRARFDDVGEVWLSTDADPRHSDLIIDSTASAGGWFGPQHDPHQVHIRLEVLSRFEGPLYMSLLGSSGRSDEFLLVRGSAGWMLPEPGDCVRGEMQAEYFSSKLMNAPPVGVRCEPIPSETRSGSLQGYIIDNWEPLDPITLEPTLFNIDPLAESAGVGSDDFAIRYTTSVEFPVDGQYTLRARARGYSAVYISGALMHGLTPGYIHNNQDRTSTSAFKAGVHEVIVDFRDSGGAARMELTYALSTTGRYAGAIDASNPIVQEHVRDIVPVNQHGFPVELGAVRAIRLRNPDDATCLKSAVVTVRGRGYTFSFPECFDGEAEIDVASAQPVLDLSILAPASIPGDDRVAREGLASWYKWSSWDKFDQVWYDASGNDKDALPLNGMVLQTVTETGSHGAAGTIGYVAGDFQKGIMFGGDRGIIATQFTICSVTRYTGTHKGRVLNGPDNNWLHGHHAGKAGVAHYNTWKTPQTIQTTDDHDWVVL